MLNLRIETSSADAADFRRWRTEPVGEAGVRTVAHGFTRGKDARFGFRSALQRAKERFPREFSFAR